MDRVSSSEDSFVEGVLRTGSLIVQDNMTPASATAIGETGQIAWNSTHLYICVATNTWRRVPISSW